ncbi:hypothetical protein LCGC14_2823890, partial [marine sediment metagenome]
PYPDTKGTLPEPMQGGQVIQQGSHATLIAEPGYYQELYRKQLEEKEMD